MTGDVQGFPTSKFHGNAKIGGLRGQDDSCTHEIMHLARETMKEGMLTNYHCACAGEIFDSGVLSTFHFMRFKGFEGT
jgi:hypothetical protein